MFPWVGVGWVLTLASLGWAGQRALARHRLVNDALKDEFAAGLHALIIKAKTPAEVAE